MSDSVVSNTGDGSLQGRRPADGDNKAILITTSMTQDVENRSEMGSEKDLVY